LPWSYDACAGISTAGRPFGDVIARWRAADAAQAPPPGQIVAVGSSSMRRWPTAFAALSPWGVVQRGFGGARLADVAASADDVIVRAHPSAVLLFAGTNDVADGFAATEVVDAWRCVVQRVFTAQGPTPIFFVGITPVPARADRWDVAAAVNDAVAADAAQHPSLSYIDMPTALFATGDPPDPALFVADGIHLSTQGYALWTSTIVNAIAGLPLRPRPAPTSGLPPGSLVRVDLGPDDGVDGIGAPAVDGFGIHWNEWSGIHGNEQVLAGEALRALVTTTGSASDVAVVITGGFRANGLRNGGLLHPDGARLGTMAVAEATSDFFFVGVDPDDPGGLALTGLRPGARHTVRLFGSRSTRDERRVTRYLVSGAGRPVSLELVTSGAGVGADGSDANVSVVAVASGVVADAWGQILIDVDVAEGQFAYLSLLEVEAER
jgi:lysophospholipase L1-like esterase